MSENLLVDTTKARHTVPEALWRESEQRIERARITLHSGRGRGAEFTGWLDLPIQAPAWFPDLYREADRIRSQSEVLVVIGIGGSYLGSRAILEALTVPFGKTDMEIVFAGHHLDGEYLDALCRYLEDREFSINVISKSGTTTEPAIAFRILRGLAERKYGREGARSRIFATTDATRGALRSLAEQEGYSTFVIPDTVGGRFSVLTPVGLFPLAVAGVDLHQLVNGAAILRDKVLHQPHSDNPAMNYATLRDAMYHSGKSIELLASMEPRLGFLGEWWKQLFGECEGKQGKGLFPAAVAYTTDLHSLGQYVQDGQRLLFETFLTTARKNTDLVIPASEDDGDGLNYLTGRALSWINAQAWSGTEEAHLKGGVPCATITLPDLGPSSIGQALYFFEYAVALSGYALDVNPFDQPGVEEYKTNMFRLMGKA